MHEKNKYVSIGIERTAYLDGLKPYLEQEQRRRGRFLPIVELKHNQQAKELRIRGLIPRYSAGSIRHVEKQCSALEEELLQFPMALFDDCSDSAGYMPQIVKASGKRFHVHRPSVVLGKNIFRPIFRAFNRK